MGHRLRITALLTALACAGCAGSIATTPVFTGEPCFTCQDGSCPAPLEIQYLGSGGFVFRRGGDTVLTGPFFTHSNLLRAAILPIAPDAEEIDRWMPDLPEASAILVGHSHYDHLMDVPRVASVQAPHATVYVNDTGAHLLAGADPPLASVIPLDERAWSPGQPEQWTDIPGTRIRFLAITSEHAPHLHGIKVMGGEVESDQTALPHHATGWKEGQTLAFLIEFLGDDGSVDFRVHHQDAASNAPVGFPPERVQAVDVLIPCVASFHEVENYPGGIIAATRPRHIVAGHWEDFFRPYTRDVVKLRSVRLTNVRRFLDLVDQSRMLDTRVTLPAPGVTMRIARCR